MPGVNDLSGKVSLDTTDFKTAISTLNREIRVIESGFRAASAGLGDWSKSATGLEGRIKALSGTIDIQKQKVSALESEYERVRAEKGENSKAAQELEIKLNKEKETLGKLEHELGETEKSLGEMGEESKDAGKAAEGLAKDEDKAEKSTGKLKAALDKLKGGIKNVAKDFKNLGDKVLKGVAVGIAGVGVAAAAAVVGIGAFVLKTAAAADEIVESAEKIGITTTQYQEFQFVAEQVGTDVETVGRAFFRTTKAIVDAEKQGSPMAKTFADLGVSVRDANGELRASEDVFGDLIGALSKVENETEREILAQQLFGKSYQELIPLINLGTDGLADMTKQAHEMGAVMDEETVTSMADLNDKIAALKGGFKGLVGQLVGSFAPILTSVADKMTNWLASPAVKQGIENLKNGIQSIINAIKLLITGDFQGGIFNLQEDDPAIAALFKIRETIISLATTIGDFMTNILIPFVKEHWVELRGALITVGAILAGAAIVSGIVAIGTAVAALVTPIGAIIAIAALLGAAWAGNWGGIRDKTQAVIDFIKPYITIAIQFIQHFIGEFLFTVRKWWAEHGEQVMAIVAGFINGVRTTIQTVINVISSIISTVLGAIQKFWSAHGDTITKVASLAWDNIRLFISKTIEQIKNVFALFRLAFEGDWEGFGAKLREMWDTAWDGIKTAFGNTVEAIKTVAADLIASVIKFFTETDWGQVGEDIVLGIAAGITAGAKWAVNAITALAQSLWAALTGFFQSKSPSKRMLNFGEQRIAGDMAQGFLKGIPKLNAAINAGLQGLGLQAGTGAQGVISTNRQAVNIYGGLNLSGINNSQSLLEELARLMP